MANPPHQNETEVVINVQSANISLPHFSNHHYLFTIPEDASIGTVVGRLQQNQQQILSSVRFSIASHSGSSEIPFSVDQSSGRLIVNSPLDREKVAEWRFIVRLSSALNNIVGEDSDMAVGTLAMVTIRLSDVNDNAPQFHGIYERIAISEDSPIGTSVAVMSATDADSGPNSRIFFSIEQVRERR
ncbi:unnamed protein product [Anisakis simplex]|uniref:Cadherin domain-containing protein n=1 Tax=Anisakis simplex TaxID=6269 RepID=A0A3P6NTM9_ANISI|nr:unnamed protein product [Anisakis simplex]